MMPTTEPTVIGLSEAAHARLQRLKEDGYFNEMSDAYRFAIALAIGQGVRPGEVQPPKTSVFYIGTLDPDRQIYNAISSLYDTGDVPVYRWAERLAEWGVMELSRQSETGGIAFASLLSSE
jgi:hypothetical protein